ncbi:MAG: uridylate kinase [Bacteroides sp. SM23_62_1]|nr:MAG: uridylate kinase [Bacteroides sp. SM23_62_1]
MIKYKRILLKLSGEALMGKKGYGIDETKLTEYTQQISEINKMGVEIGIVIGGGNIFRGLSGTKKGFDRIKGDYMGMLATVINGLAIQSALEQIGTTARLFTAISMTPVGTHFNEHEAVYALQNGEVAIFTFGTGNPYFTTDTAASLRAIQIKAEVLLKGTRVDGVYSADPEKDKSALKFEEISFDEVLARQLQVMDLTAFTLCMENNLPILVFDMNTKGNLKKIVSGSKIGTIVKN